MGMKKFIESKRNRLLWKPIILFKDFFGYIKHDIKNLYYLKTRIIFIPIPKVACVSLKKAFRKKVYFYEKRKDYSINVPPLPRFINTDNYYVFAFVRNPFDRLVSCYVDRLKRKNKMFLDNVSKYNINSNMNFKEFVKAISKIPDEYSDTHFKSQVCFLMKDGKLIPNFIGKIETIDEDFNSICKVFNIDSKLEHLNTSKNREPYEIYYDEETIKLVEERYKEDLKVFDYKYEEVSQMNQEK